MYRFTEASNSACLSLQLYTNTEIFKQYGFFYPLGIYTSFGKILFVLFIAGLFQMIVLGLFIRSVFNFARGKVQKGYKYRHEQKNSRFLGYTYKPLKFQNRKQSKLLIEVEVAVIGNARFNAGKFLGYSSKSIQSGSPLF